MGRLCRTVVWLRKQPGGRKVGDGTEDDGRDGNACLIFHVYLVVYLDVRFPTILARIQLKMLRFPSHDPRASYQAAITLGKNTWKIFLQTTRMIGTSKQESVPQQNTQCTRRFNAKTEHLSLHRDQPLHTCVLILQSRRISGAPKTPKDNNIFTCSLYCKKTHIRDSRSWGCDYLTACRYIKIPLFCRLLCHLEQV